MVDFVSAVAVDDIVEPANKHTDTVSKPDKRLYIGGPL